MTAHSPLIYILAGEPSGDLLGAKLIRALRKKNPDLRFRGVGGFHMQAEGLDSLFPMQELSIMGFLEIIPHAPRLFRRIRETVADIESTKPDVVITIDSPGFNKRIAQRIRHLAMPKIHYVAPTVWAYKPKRAQKFAALFDHLLLLLPFEPLYFDKVGLKNTFIGHPIVEDSLPSEKRIQSFRKKHGIKENETLLLVMAGSRIREIKTLLPIFQECCARYCHQHPSTRILFACLPHHEPLLTQLLSGWNVAHTLVSNNEEKQVAMSVADLGIIKSGTSSLEVAYHHTPHLIAYRVRPFSAWLIRRMVKIPYVNLINIIAGHEIIPEHIQERCTPELLHHSLEAISEDKGRKKKQQEISQVFVQLGQGDALTPSEKAADVVLSYVKGRG